MPFFFFRLFKNCYWRKVTDSFELFSFILLKEKMQIKDLLHLLLNVPCTVAVHGNTS